MDKGFTNRGVVLMGVRVVGVGLTFLATLLLTRTLGVQDFGRYAFIFAIINLAILPSQFGVPELVIRETSKLNSHNKPALMKALWRWAHRFLILSALFVITSLVVISLFAPSYSDSSFYLALAIIPLAALSNLRAAIVRGLGRDLIAQFPEYIIRPFVFVFGLFIFIFFYHSELNVFDVFAIQIFSVFLAMGFGTLVLWRISPKVASDMTDQLQRKVWFRSCFNMGFISALLLLNNSIDLIMLGVMKSEADVGVYRLASTLGALVTLGVQTMNLYTMPHVARLFASGRDAEVASVVAHGSRLAFGFSLLSVCVIFLLGEPLIGLLFGQDFRGAFLVLIVLILGHLANAFFGQAGVILMMGDLEKLFAIITGLGVLANVILNLCLIPEYGAVGAAVAASISVALAKVVTFIIVWRRFEILAWPLFPSKRKV